MNNTDRLQATVNQAFGNDTTILRSNEKYVLVRYRKGYSTEFATLIHDWDGVYLGHYFIAWGVSVDDYSNVRYQEARERAIADYENRIK